MASPPDLEHLAALRREYEQEGLDEADLTGDPLELFGSWFGQVHAAGLPEPNAMVVATATADASPAARFLLLKGVVDGTFVFYTNLESRKGVELLANPRCALLFPWFPLQRQVRVEGEARLLPRERVEDYFAARPRAAQLGAWASHQSQEVGSRGELQAAYDEADARFADGPVPCPAYWGGFAVRPLQMEFWQGRSGRMHDRIVYRRNPSDGWTTGRLAP
jgi:pyridoxamine 5'-phosphate oxidase